TLMQSPGHFDLGDLECFGNFVGQLLQSAKGAQPAAKCTAAPEDQRNSNGAPQHENQWVNEKGLPGKALAQCGCKGQHVDHRGLGRHNPAQPNQSNGQVHRPDTIVGALVFNDSILEKEDPSQCQQHEP